MAGVGMRGEVYDDVCRVGRRWTQSRVAIAVNAVLTLVGHGEGAVVREARGGRRKGASSPSRHALHLGLDERSGSARCFGEAPRFDPLPPRFTGPARLGSHHGKAARSRRFARRAAPGGFSTTSTTPMRRLRSRKFRERVIPARAATRWRSSDRVGRLRADRHDVCSRFAWDGTLLSSVALSPEPLTAALRRAGPAAIAPASSTGPRPCGTHGSSLTTGAEIGSSPGPGRYRGG